MTVDYANRTGADRAEAIGKAPLATVTGWFIDVAVLVIAGVAVGVGLHGSGVARDLGEAEPLVALVGGLLVVALATIALVPRIRQRVAPPILSVLAETWRSLRSPRQVAELFAGGLFERLAFAASLLAAVAATGSGISYWEAMLVSGTALAAGGVVPTPGGVGVAEGVLTAGLVAVGVPEASAIAAMLIHRTANAYLPPVYGVEALRELRRDGLL